MRWVREFRTTGMVVLLNGVLLASSRGRMATTLLPNARFVADLHGKKIDDVMRLYTADAVVVNPDASVAHAGPELRALYERVTGTTDSEMRLHPVIVRQTGRNVEELGKYKEKLRQRDTGKEVVIKGMYVFTGRREADGVYRYSRMEWR